MQKDREIKEEAHEMYRNARTDPHQALKEEKTITVILLFLSFNMANIIDIIAFNPSTRRLFRRTRDGGECSKVDRGNSDVAERGSFSNRKGCKHYLPPLLINH